MKIDRLELANFGKFKGKVIELSPGLNLIYGANESGKSTVQSFIRGMLFGFKKQGNRRSYDSSLESFRPWEGVQYSGTMEYTLDGKCYRIERTFSPEEEKVRILDGNSWEDLTGRFSMDKRKEVLFAQEQLGISPVIFDNTLCIRQMQRMSSADLAGEIQSKLLNVSTSGEEDVSIRKALEALDIRLKEVGLTERSGKSLLGKITSQVEELESLKETTLEAYGEIEEAEAGLQETSKRLKFLSAKQQALVQELRAIEAREIGQRLDKLQEYDLKIAGLKGVIAEKSGNFPTEKRETLLLLLERQKLVGVSLQELEKRLDEVAEKRTVGQQSLRKLQSFGTFDQGSIIALESGFARLEGTNVQIGEFEEKRVQLKGSLTNLEQQYNKLRGCAQLGALGEQEALRLEEEIREQSRPDSSGVENKDKTNKAYLKGIFAIVGLIIGALGLIFALSSNLDFLAFPAGAFILGAVGLGLSATRGRKRSPEITSQPKGLSNDTNLQGKRARLNALLSTAGVENIRELTEKMRQFALVEDKRETLSQELALLEANIAALKEKHLAETKSLKDRFLLPAGITSAIPIEREHIDKFCYGVNQSHKLLAGQQELTRREEELLQEKNRQLEERDNARGQVMEILQRAGVNSPEEFMVKYEAVCRHNEAERELNALVTARDGLLGVHSEQELQELFKRLKLESQQPETARPAHEVKTELDTLSSEIQENKELIAKLQGIIQTRLKGIRNLADIEGQLEQFGEAKKQIYRQREALILAKQLIQEVFAEVQQEFAPLVNAQISKTIDSITAGRYLAAKIDKNLEIRVVTPETGGVTDVMALSQGTVDQFYFALRLALADTVGVRFPLILDEPFSQYDDKRLEAVLAILLELAATRQIIIFTCQKREMEILLRNGTGGAKAEVIHL